jgi:hypothetical protein
MSSTPRPLYPSIYIEQEAGCAPGLVYLPALEPLFFGHVASCPVTTDTWLFRLNAHTALCFLEVVVWKGNKVFILVFSLLFFLGKRCWLCIPPE